MCEENHYFFPINDSDVNPGIDALDEEANDEKMKKTTMKPMGTIIMPIWIIRMVKSL